MRRMPLHSDSGSASHASTAAMSEEKPRVASKVCHTCLGSSAE
jgi:hypothetical protein